MTTRSRCRWTDEEISLLKDRARNTPSVEIAKLLGRGQQAVQKKAQEHGVRFLVEQKADGTLRRGWTKAEETMLWGLSETMSMQQAAQRLGRTEKSIRRKATKLGISFRERRMTIQEVADLLGVSFMTVTRRRDKLLLNFRTTSQNNHFTKNQTRGATGKDLVALAKDILDNPPMGRPHLKATASHLRQVILDYADWE